MAGLEHGIFVRSYVTIGLMIVLCLMARVTGDRWPGKPRIYGDKCSACTPFPKDLVDDTLTLEKTLDKWTRTIQPNNLISNKINQLTSDALNFKSKVHMVQTVENLLHPLATKQRKKRDLKRSSTVGMYVRDASKKCDDQLLQYYDLVDQMRMIVRQGILGEVRSLLKLRDKIASAGYKKVIELANFGRKVQRDMIYKSQRGPKNPVLDRDRFSRAQNDMRRIERGLPLSFANGLHPHINFWRSSKLINQVRQFSQMSKSTASLLRSLQKKFMEGHFVSRLVDLEEKAAFAHTDLVVTMTLQSEMIELMNKVNEIKSLPVMNLNKYNSLRNKSKQTVADTQQYHEVTKQIVQKLMDILDKPFPITSVGDLSQVALVKRINDHVTHMKERLGIIKRLLSPVVQKYAKLIRNQAIPKENMLAYKIISRMNKYFYKDLYLLLQNCPSYHTTSGHSIKPDITDGSGVYTVTAPTIIDGSGSGMQDETPSDVPKPTKERTDFSFIDDEDLSKVRGDIVWGEIELTEGSSLFSGIGETLPQPPTTKKASTFCENVMKTDIGPGDFEGMTQRLRQLYRQAMWNTFHSEEIHRRSVAALRRVPVFEKRLKTIKANCLSFAKAEVALVDFNSQLTQAERRPQVDRTNILQQIHNVDKTLRRVEDITQKAGSIQGQPFLPQDIPGVQEVTYAKENISQFINLQGKLELKVKQIGQKQQTLRSSIDRLKAQIREAKKVASKVSVHLDTPVSLAIPKEAKQSVYTAIFSVSIRSELSNAIILHTVNGNKLFKEDLELSLLGGKPHLRWSRNGYKAELTLPKAINNGYWYRLTAQRIRDRIFLRSRSLDPKILPFDGFQEKDTIVDSWKHNSILPAIVYIGDNIQAGAFGGSRHFNGCMANLTINAQPMVIWQKNVNMRPCTLNKESGTGRIPPIDIPGKTTEDLTRFKMTPKLTTMSAKLKSRMTTEAIKVTSTTTEKSEGGGNWWGNSKNQPETGETSETTTQTASVSFRPISSTTTLKSTTQQKTTLASTTQQKTPPSTRPTVKLSTRKVPSTTIKIRSTSTKPTIRPTTTTSMKSTSTTHKTTTSLATSELITQLTTMVTTPQPPNTASFGGDGFFKMDEMKEFDDLRNMELRFTFKSSKDGAIFYVVDDSYWSPDSYLVIFLSKGRVKVKFNYDGTKTEDIVSNQKYDDGALHVLKVKSTSSNIVLTVDEADNKVSKEPVQSGKVDRFFFGGMPEDDHDNTGELNNFTGCLMDVTINKQPVNFETATKEGTLVKITDKC